MKGLSRRAFLRGTAAGAGVAMLAPVLRGLPFADARKLKHPGSLPNPTLPAGVDTLPQIEHIVVVMMENHSYDSYFGMLGRGDGFHLGGDGQPTNACPAPDGTPVRSYHAPSTCQAHYDVGQAWDTSHRSWNYGSNDGFVTASSTDAMAYWTGDDLPFYYDLARTFPLCDRYFASVMAQTYPNRRFLLAATALGQVSDPLPGPNDPPPPNGTIMDLLNAHGITWKDYFVDLPTTGLFPSIIKSNPDKIRPAAEFLVDAAAGTLPNVSIIDPDGFYASEENPQDIQAGEFYAAQMINAAMSGPAWERTIVVFTYDEHGGYYDHVPPVPTVAPDSIGPDVAPNDTYGDLYTYTGFRVPTVVISPWAKKNYVSHAMHEHCSILRLIETKWNLPALTYRDANASNLLDCFDFTVAVPPFLEPPVLAAAPAPTGVPACIAADPRSPI